MHEEMREARFRRIYERHYASLLAYALRRAPDRAEAQDVVADAFLVLWRRLGDAPEDDEQILPWLYGVIHRVLANRLRARQRQERLTERFAQMLADEATLEEIASHRQDAQRLLQALLELSERERELLLLSAWERLPTSELARVFGCSENAAAIRLHRARKRLIELYEEKETGATGHKHSERLRLRRPQRRRRIDE